MNKVAEYNIRKACYHDDEAEILRLNVAHSIKNELDEKGVVFSKVVTQVLFDPCRFEAIVHVEVIL